MLFASKMVRPSATMACEQKKSCPHYLGHVWPPNEHVVIDSLLPFYPLKSSGYSIDDGFQTISAWNHQPLRFSNHQSSFILVPHNIYIYIYTRKSTQIALESSIFTWSALYQPANFKATKRLLPTSKLTTGIAERVAPQALCWTWLPPTCHVGVLAQMEKRGNLAKPVLFENQ